MFAVPPATTMSASPASIIWAAMLTQLSPEPQTTLTVTAGVVTGSPALMEAWRGDVLAQTRLDNATHIDVVNLFRGDAGRGRSLP